jgi:hypothetical protein
MRTASLIMAIGISVWAVVACGEKKRASETRPKRTDIVVYDTPEGLSRMIKPPTPVAAVRWALVPVVPQTRDGLGPTDENFYAVLTLDSAQWPVWERALAASASPGEYYLMEEVAEKLLPPEWLSSSVSDSLKGGRRITGTFYDLDSIHTGWGRNGLAIRHDKYLFLDFYLN